MRMKLSIVLLLAAATLVSAAGADQAWTGAISDKMCGADHQKMGGKMSASECTLACTKGGAPYVLVVEGKVFELKNHESDLRKYAGQIVTVTGTVKGDTITVSSVEAKR